MRLSDYLPQSEYVSDFSASDVYFNVLSTDSRDVTTESLFIALPGHRHDALQCLAEVSILPAAIILKENTVLPSKLENVPHFFVKNPRRTVAFLYSALNGDPANGMTVIGITGTAGKSSTAEFLYRILLSAGIPTAVIGTIHKEYSPATNAETVRNDRADTMTTPEPSVLYPLLRKMKNAGVTHVVMEVSSQALLDERVSPIPFAVGVFTNLSPEHLDCHGDMERYFAAKKILFSLTDTAVINVDDDYGTRLYRDCSCKKHSVGILSPAENEVTDLIFDENISYTLRTPKEDIPVFLSVSGVFQVYNAALAAVCARILSIPAETVTETIRNTRMICGRMEKLNLTEYNLPYSVYIDYAHTPDALKNLLSSARRLPHKRILLLFGCGGDRDTKKRPEMGRVAATADYFIITEDNSRSESTDRIISDILTGVPKTAHFSVIPDRAAAIRALLAKAKAGDILLFAGKGHETYEIGKDGMHPFNERETIMNALSDIQNETEKKICE